jgi:hypothetical protein
VRAVNNTEVNFLTVLWKGIAASARQNAVTSYAAENASVLSWILPFKPATLFTGVVTTGEGEYLGWHVLPNFAVTLCACLAFIGCTVKVVMDFVQKKNDKITLRMRRGYIVLFGGMLLALFAGLIRGNVSAQSSVLFHVFYLGFLPLVATTLPEETTAKSKMLIQTGLIALTAVFVAVFVLSLPVAYGYAVTAGNAKLFTWMSFVSNGFFK